MAVGDVNGDRRDDLYVSGAKDSPEPCLYRMDRHFKNKQTLSKPTKYRKILIVHFDADRDGDLIYMLPVEAMNFRGSSVWPIVCINDGKDTLSTKILPVGKYESTLCTTCRF